MVNGAGLAMATMDLIHYKGGEPAVFLDCGGGASEAQVQKAFEIMNSDPFVKAIFVNIFGGIMRCDIIASGIIKAHKHIGVKKPVVIRLRGNKVNEAMALLEASDVPLILVDDYEEAAAKAIEMSDSVTEVEKVGSPEEILLLSPSTAPATSRNSGTVPTPPGQTIRLPPLSLEASSSTRKPASA